MGPITMEEIMERVLQVADDITYLKKVEKDECDRLSKDMAKDEEQWKREEYKDMWAKITKSKHFGQIGCGGGLQYLLVPNGVQVLSMWNGKVSKHKTNTQNES